MQKRTINDPKAVMGCCWIGDGRQSPSSNDGIQIWADGGGEGGPPGEGDGAGSVVDGRGGASAALPVRAATREMREEEPGRTFGRGLQ